MGIPSLFRKIIENYNDSYISTSDYEQNIDNFYIDFNAMIYNAFHLFEKRVVNKMKDKEIENELIKEVIQFLQFLITKIVKPSKKVYIAFDGSAPMAKIIQQRARRFKSPYEETMINKMKKENNIPESIIKFNKSKISPGTKFMNKLSKEIKKSIQNGYLYQGLKLNKIILSDTSVPGEGEHKFIPDIKRNHDQDINVIYSPDGDVIVLSLIPKNKNILIIKPFSDFGENIKYDKNNPPEFLYLNMTICKEYFIQSITQYAGIENHISYLNDWIFLTLLSGNDFVIPLPFLKMNKMNKIMGILNKFYKEVYENINENLIIENNNNVQINYKFFILLVEKISNEELKQFQKNLKHIHYVKNNGNKNADSFEEKLTDFEKMKMRFYHRNFYDKKNPLFHIYYHEFNKINYFNHNWKENYYKYFFRNYDLELIDQICHDYIKILTWNLQYYFKSKPPSWTFCYHHRMPPLFSDLYNYLQNNKNLIIKFENDQPFQPLKQLLLILSPYSKNLLPKCLGDLMQHDQLKSFYPKIFKLDVVVGNKYIYSEPILPKINIELLDYFINQNYDKLTLQEKKRNKIQKKLVYQI